MHVLLGSQTLGGAYTLARSTIDQMAVRIALQCSEADAHLILSEDNSAARLLSRPGEAIYNDANGLVEGNHPFQVVWLSDERKEEYLRRIRELAQRHRHVRPAADRVRRQSARPTRQESAAGCPVGAHGVARAAARAQGLARRGDRHQGPDGRGLPPASRREPADRRPAAGGRDRHVDDGHRQSGGAVRPGPRRRRDRRQRRGRSTARGSSFSTACCPTRRKPVGFDAWPACCPIRRPSSRPATCRASSREIDAEVARRETAGGDEAPPWFLIAYDLGRFRDLRKADDDFSFGSVGEDKPANPAKQFAHILREGPGLGVHTLGVVRFV